MQNFQKLAALAALLLLTNFTCKTTQKATQTEGEKPQPIHFQNIKIAEAQPGDGYGPCEPSIAVNPKNIRNIVAGAILDRVYHSNDGGKTWQSEKLKSSHGVFGDPVIIADWKGDFYYAHLSDPEHEGWASDSLLDKIVIQKSLDGGKSWSDGSFCGSRHPKDQDKHWLVADPKNNHLLCTWTEFDKYNSADKAKDKSRILFSKSEDGGKSWSNALAINEFDGDCLDDDFTTEGAVPAFGPNGEIYCAWAFDEKLWFDRSLDGGKTWMKKDIEVARQPGGWTLEVPGISRCNGLPILVCDLSNSPNKGTLYLNWGDQKNGADDSDIWLAKSKDGGTTWSKPVRVNNDRTKTHQFLPWLAIDQTNGNLYSVFYDRRNHKDKKTDVYLAISRDGGDTFENLKISESSFDPSQFVFFGDYNNISAHAGVVRPIWTRMEGATLSVWTALIDFKKSIVPKDKEVQD